MDDPTFQTCKRLVRYALTDLEGKCRQNLLDTIKDKIGASEYYGLECEVLEELGQSTEL